jgi:hypothetical protein
LTDFLYRKRRKKTPLSPIALSNAVVDGGKEEVENSGLNIS